jgi:hypothetical protein
VTAREVVARFEADTRISDKHPRSLGSEAAAAFEDGANGSPVRAKEGPKAMAGSPDAVFSRIAARCSVLPSCSWLSPLRENHERHPKCSIFTVLSSIGAGAS